MTANLKIIKYFIKNAPVGEASDILNDVSNIVGYEFL